MNKLFVILLLLSTGCASTSDQPLEPVKNSNVYRRSFDNVWRATQIALQNYPVKMNNSEKGVIETEFIKEGEVWQHPTQSAQTSNRYQIKVRTIKGVIKSKPAIKVIITKHIKKFKNFIDGSKESISKDHLEEATLLYRIKRELIIDHALSKLQQKE